MPTYQLYIATPFHQLRMSGYNIYEAEEFTAKITHGFSEFLGRLGYKTSTSGDPLYDGYDGLVTTDRMLGLDGLYVFERMKRELSVPLSIEMVEKLLEFKK